MKIGKLKLNFRKSKKEHWVSKVIELSETKADIYHNFEYVLSDDETIIRLVEYIKKLPRRCFDRQNINIGYGVSDSERKVFITLIYYLFDCIKRCDDGIDFIHNNNSHLWEKELQYNNPDFNLYLYDRELKKAYFDEDK